MVWAMVAVGLSLKHILEFRMGVPGEGCLPFLSLDCSGVEGWWRGTFNSRSVLPVASGSEKEVALDLKRWEKGQRQV